jgi:hypothetical protein
MSRPPAYQLLRADCGRGIPLADSSIQYENPLKIREFRLFCLVSFDINVRAEWGSGTSTIRLDSPTLKHLGWRCPVVAAHQSSTPDPEQSIPFELSNDLPAPIGKHKVCPQCGKPKDRVSSVCKACYNQKIARPENYFHRQCRKCGKDFTVHRATVVRGQGWYCSRSCARSGSPTRKRNRRLASCLTCGKRVERFPSEDKKKTTDKHFCSTECWYEYNQRENHYCWAGGQDERMNPDANVWRKTVLRRDRRRCRFCHSRRRLQVHHILPFSTHADRRWDVTNGITLCFSCHGKLRHKELEFAEFLQFLITLPVHRCDVPKKSGPKKSGQSSLPVVVPDPNEYFPLFDDPKQKHT